MTEQNPTRTVLVVDDERTVADSLAIILKQNNFDATPVYSGEHALELARQSAPDALVCDILLGGINGIEVAKQICALYPDCRIILISGANQSADLLEEANAAGYALEVLAKPFHPTTLIDKLREALGPSTEAA